MTTVTYRGVEYDTKKHQTDFKLWWNLIHCDATRWLMYRGKKYRAYDQCRS